MILPLNYISVVADISDGIVTSGTNKLLEYGIAGLFILFLILTLVVVTRRYLAREAKIDLIQDQRLAEAKEVRDKLSEPLQKIVNQNDKIYDVLLNDKRRG